MSKARARRNMAHRSVARRSVPMLTARIEAGGERFHRLPEPPARDQLVESVPATQVRDPRGGRDTDTEFMLRYAAF